MSEVKLMGYARKGNNGNVLKVNLSMEAIRNAEVYTGVDGQDYLPLTIRGERVQDILEGVKEVTCVTQFLDDEGRLI